MTLQTCVLLSTIVFKPDANSLFSIIVFDNFNFASARRRITSIFPKKTRKFYDGKRLLVFKPSNEFLQTRRIIRTGLKYNTSSVVLLYKICYLFCPIR